MTVSEKIKNKIDAKIKQNKAQYDLDRQTAKISASSSGNVGKYEFLTGEDVLLEKDLLEKAATIKIFELKKEDEVKRKLTSEKYKKWDIVYNNKFSFYKYHNINEFRSISFEKKYD